MMNRLTQCRFLQRGLLFSLIIFMGSMNGVAEEASLEKSKITEGILFIEALDSDFKVQKIVKLKDDESFSAYVRVSSKTGLRTFVIKQEGVFEEKEDGVLVLIKKFPLNLPSTVVTNTPSASEKN